MQTRSGEQRHVAIDQIAAEQGSDAAEALLAPSDAGAVEDRLEQVQRHALLVRHLQALPAEFRETLILREIEELSYREIADVLQAPIGTVMSRLARGRALLQKSLGSAQPNEVKHGL